MGDILATPSCSAGHDDHRLKAAEMERRLMRTVCPRTRTETASLLLTLVLLLILQLAVQGSALSPPPGSVKIDGFSFMGSGCPPGSTEGAVSEDGQTMTVKFSEFTATTHKSEEDRKRSCQISVDLSYPEGFALSLRSITLTGYANLDGGVSGSIDTQYYFPGQSGTARSTRNIQGAFDDNFENNDGFDLALYSKCGNKVSLSLVVVVKVNPGALPSEGGSIDVDNMYAMSDLVWKEC